MEQMIWKKQVLFPAKDVLFNYQLFFFFFQAKYRLKMAEELQAKVDKLTSENEEMKAKIDELTEKVKALTSGAEAAADAVKETAAEKVEELKEQLDEKAAKAVLGGLAGFN